MSETEFKEMMLQRTARIEEGIKHIKEKQEDARQKANENRRKIHALERINYNLRDNCPHTPVIEGLKNNKLTHTAIKKYIIRTIIITTAVVGAAVAVLGFMINLI